MLCFAEFTCKVDAIYYATSSAIKGVFSDGNSTVTILSESNVKLNYDSLSERLLYYDDDNLIIVKLDGSNATIIASLSTILRFAVDHTTRNVYYITNLFRNVRSIDLDTGADNLVSSDLGSGVEDLDTDPNNRSLVFAGASNGDIVRYFLDNGAQEVVYNNNRSPRFLSVDSEYEVIYWIDYIAANDSYFLMKTYFNGSISQVNYYYPCTTSSIKIAIGRDDFYVMDSTRGRIDRFDRRTVSLQNTFYLGDTAEEFTIVQDLDECCIGGYCHDNATCTNTPGSHFCTCKEGFIGNNTHCEDINECETQAPCHANATCKNVDGSYYCACSGNGFFCEDECKDLMLIEKNQLASAAWKLTGEDEKQVFKSSSDDLESWLLAKT
ncbi:Aggrecan core [Paramuricea clavata]|uniref:Aggrecan core n=1 Tax=Paramuricea clavata TaxID=317549 RepID=A0A7D9H6U6_PARCT|nr:Aggrecan core [Paramuricea clavata]